MSHGNRRTGTRGSQGFKTHRCDCMPRGFSLRLYDGISDTDRMVYGSGYMLSKLEFDPETMEDVLEPVHGVHYCPWCGKRLWSAS